MKKLLNEYLDKKIKHKILLKYIYILKVFF
jgi:hypothetical protein